MILGLVGNQREKNLKLEDKHAKDKLYCTFWDHYHFTGEYRCTAHNTWNLKYIMHLKKLL